jgi:chemotaxis protein MotA
MISIVGIVVVFVMVFGGYALAGGKFGIIVKALPFEMMMIGGAALGAFLIANSGAAAKGAQGHRRVFKGPRWKPKTTATCCACCSNSSASRGRTRSSSRSISRVRRPRRSSQRYPTILADHEAVELICDTMRSATMNYDDPNQVEEVLDKRMEATITMRCIPATRSRSWRTVCRRSGSSRRCWA